MPIWGSGAHLSGRSLSAEEAAQARATVRASQLMLKLRLGREQKMRRRGENFWAFFGGKRVFNDFRARYKCLGFLNLRRVSLAGVRAKVGAAGRYMCRCVKLVAAAAAANEHRR